ncbi:MAG: DnaA regulatory inactivator Hda [Gammaproteobacteria bacterium]
MRQIPLAIVLPGSVSFDTYHGDRNALAFAAVRQLAAGESREPLYLFGTSGCGKSHLLQAACNVVSQRGARAFYLSFSDPKALDPTILSELELLDFIALDDLQRIAGDEEWERALFALFNATSDTRTPLLFSAAANPGGLGIRLPDLVSRLSACTIYRLEELTDQEKIRALQAAAKQRGMELSEEVGGYLLTRTRRDMGSLLDTLDRLDQASLEAQRRLTIPFVRGVLGS